MTPTRLDVCLDATLIGVVERGKAGRVSFTYEPTWQARADAMPLSVSMPLAVSRHEHAVVEPWLWGLLPDNELILERWARRFHASARSAFSLLAHVGKDCPGAVRLLSREERSAEADLGGEVTWLTEREVAERLRHLRDDVSAWRVRGDTGQFSLAGAQPKTALIWDGRRWGVPSGRVPTSHILKPGIFGLDASAENEHFCLVLARALGLPAAHSHVAELEDERAIVVERYDRAWVGSTLHRVHQEDMCQALCVSPALKYQSEGGPSPARIIELLRAVSGKPEEDVRTFVRALLFNWLIGGTDAHAKNYSLLIGAGARVRLAPLYDVASALPYKEIPLQKLKLAMKIGGKYRLRDIGRGEWEALAKDSRLPFEQLLEDGCSMARALPDAASDISAELAQDDLSGPVLERLHTSLVERARRCATTLGA
jgi:serine/threonine-protein kinase HipA